MVAYYSIAFGVRQDSLLARAFAGGRSLPMYFPDLLQGRGPRGSRSTSPALFVFVREDRKRDSRECHQG